MILTVSARLLFRYLFLSSSSRDGCDPYLSVYVRIISPLFCCYYIGERPTSGISRPLFLLLFLILTRWRRERRVLFIRVLLCRHHSFPSWCKIFLIFFFLGGGGGHVFLFSSCRSFLTFGNWSSAVDNGVPLFLVNSSSFFFLFLETTFSLPWRWRDEIGVPCPDPWHFVFFFSLSPRFVACV